ncbi:hypothetical protein ABFB09_02985 [Dehalogenimonas sp. THU2]|uniref:baeRF3 domain-containing protein n=1 Tax=Dehalogenimonas sp. THU2 TaxID=3151121 RepID=UPI0032186AAD
METLRKEEFSNLLQTPERPAVSIYLPTHRTGDTGADPIQLRNLLDEAEIRLIESGFRAPQAKIILAPARELLSDALFWQHQDESLALFFSPKSFRYVNLPITVAETVRVADEYYVKPLLPLITNDGDYYLLSLSMNHVALFRCRRDNCRELIPVGMPRSLDEALRFDDQEKQHQFHSATAGRGTEGRTRVDAHQYHAGGKTPVITHGQGVAKDYDEDRLLRFCQLVDRGLQEVLKEEKAPLVIASVDYLQPIFKKASYYSNILSQGIDGNPDKVNADVLQRQAWQIVKPHFLQGQEKAYAQYVNATGPGPSASDPAQIIPAAYDGRIDTLFVAQGIERWGIFDVEEHRVKLESEPSNGAVDLVEYAVKKTLINGGNVYALKEEEIPSPTGLAAVFRY